MSHSAAEPRTERSDRTSHPAAEPRTERSDRTSRPAAGPRTERSDRTSRDRLQLDPIACDAHGLCAELLPERIALDDWGYPLLADGGALPPELVAHARRAAAACPTLALRLRRAPADARQHRRSAAAEQQQTCTPGSFTRSR